MFGQTQSMTIESAELPQFFQHLASVVPIYKRPFFVKSVPVVTCISIELTHHTAGMARRTSCWAVRGDVRKGKRPYGEWVHSLWLCWALTGSTWTWKTGLAYPSWFIRRWPHPTSPLWWADLWFQWEHLTSSVKPNHPFIGEKHDTLLRRVKRMSHFPMSQTWIW